MNLTTDQQDAVTELVNIAFARTAAALSDLTRNRVELSVPEVAAHPIRELEPALAKFVRGDVATVHQIFGGQLAGDAFLLLEVDGAARLVGMLTDAEAPTRKMGQSDREVLAEIPILVAAQVVSLAKTTAHFTQNVGDGGWGQTGLSREGRTRHTLHEQVVTVDLRLTEVSGQDGGHRHVGDLHLA